MKLPLYCIVGARPVKAIRNQDGQMEVLAYNWETGDFDYGMEYLDAVVLGGDEVDAVDEQAFEQYVQQLKQRETI